MFIIVKGGIKFIFSFRSSLLSCVDYRKMVKIASDKLKMIFAILMGLNLGVIFMNIL
jgi:hypothetical protein